MTLSKSDGFSESGQGSGRLSGNQAALSFPSGLHPPVGCVALLDIKGSLKVLGTVREVGLLVS